MRARILGRDDVQVEEADEGSVDMDENENSVAINVPGNTLNMRGWPSFNPNVIAAIPDGVVVPVIRRGAFGRRPWLKVRYGGLEGWIVASHADPITQSN